MDSATGGRLAAAFLRDGQANVEAVADGVVHAWAQVDRHLAPVIGPAGVAALYRRTLSLCARHHPVLGDVVVADQRALDTATLRAGLLAQQAGVAATLGAELLLTFNELLSRMVGPSLTERLLRPVWQEITGPSPTEDPLP